MGLIADDRLRIKGRHLDNKDSTAQRTAVPRSTPEDLPILVGDSHQNMMTDAADIPEQAAPYMRSLVRQARDPQLPAPPQ
jgi:hypothetical protein